VHEEAEEVEGVENGDDADIKSKGKMMGGNGGILSLLWELKELSV